MEMDKNCMKVVCTEASFPLQDLEGATGVLRIDKRCNEEAVNWFNGGRGVCFERRRAFKKGQTWTIHTKRGNKLVFKGA